MTCDMRRPLPGWGWLLVEARPAGGRGCVDSRLERYERAPSGTFVWDIMTVLGRDVVGVN